MESDSIPTASDNYINSHSIFPISETEGHTCISLPDHEYMYISEDAVYVVWYSAIEPANEKGTL